MKRRILSIALATLFAVASCSEDDDGATQPGAGAGGVGGSAGAGSGGIGGTSDASAGGSAGRGGSAGTAGSSGTGGSGATGGTNGGSGAGGTGGGSGRGGTGGSGAAGASGTGAVDGGGNPDGASSFALTSSAFTQGAMIPQRHLCSTGGGQNISPALTWTAGPAGTQSYAVVMRDLDYMNGFLHWVIWDIPASALALPENVDHTYQPAAPAGAKQAPFNGSVTGYYGPCSPSSVNTYELTVYALPNATLSGLTQQSTNQQAASAIVAAALASAKLSGES
jgi:Raf kinase inhibitor-like YbhB/YbcL family protein